VDVVGLASMVTVRFRVPWGAETRSSQITLGWHAFVCVCFCVLCAFV